MLAILHECAERRRQPKTHWPGWSGRAGEWRHVLEAPSGVGHWKCSLVPRLTTQLTCRGRQLRPRSGAALSTALTQQAVTYSQSAGTERKTLPADRRPADGRERQVRTATKGSPVAASSRKRRTRTRTASSGSWSKALRQSGRSKWSREHGIAEERQPVAAGHQADHAVPAVSGAAGATDDHPRRHLVLRLERPQLAAGARRRTALRPTEARPETRQKCCGRNQATPRTRPRRPPGGSARPDAAGPSARRRAARQRGPRAGGWRQSVTDAGSMPAASSRVANRPTPGKSGNSALAHVDQSGPRPPLRTTTTFSGHLYTSGGWSLSASQAARSTGSALVANVAAGSGTPHR